MKAVFIGMVKVLLKVFPKKYREYYQILVVFKVNQLSSGKRKAFLKEVECRKKISLFDVEPLSKELSSYSDEYYYVNSRYGIGYHLRKYAGWNKPVNAVIEHGIYYDDDIKEMEIYNNKFPAILTYGPARHSFITSLEGHDKKVYKLGPHIDYVDSLLSTKDLKQLKDELGTVLLAIPTHSIESHRLEFDYEGWINEIKEKGKDFDTIIVNVYFQDVVFGRHQHYLNAGFKVVTSGHRSDLNFLPRLKSIIMLADMTMSNRYSTPVGYCIHLDKPHYIYQQSMVFKTTEMAHEYHADTKIDKFEKYADIFAQYSTEISSEELNVYNHVWGGEASLKSPEELYEILESCDSSKPFWL